MKKASILIIHQGALGDFVLILPFLLVLKKNYKLDLFCKGQNRIIAHYFKAAENIFPIESQIFSSIFSKNPDQILQDIVMSQEKILLFSFSEELKKQIRSIAKKECDVFLIPPRPEKRAKIHVSRYIEKRLSEIGLLTEEICLKKPVINPHGITILHPGAGSKRKRWDIYSFLKLFYMLESEGIQTAFLLGPAEKDLFPILKEYVPQEKLFLIDDTLYLLKTLSSAKGLIGNDSGVSHLSAFMGIPTLALFGPSDPKRWRPMGSKVAVLRGTNGCEPCFETNKDNCSDPVCFSNIKPKQVLQRYKELIS